MIRVGLAGERCDGCNLGTSARCCSIWSAPSERPAHNTPMPATIGPAHSGHQDAAPSAGVPLLGLLLLDTDTNKLRITLQTLSASYHPSPWTCSLEQNYLTHDPGTLSVSYPGVGVFLDHLLATCFRSYWRDLWVLYRPLWSGMCLLGVR